MARFFKEKDIDEYRECFYLFARSGQIRSVDQLTLVMRSLASSPTIAELRGFLKAKGGRLTFADFLDIMHEHAQKERASAELLQAFRGHDPRRSGTVPARELHHILTHWGERLSASEVDQVFQEAKISTHGRVKYEDLTKLMCAPLPDY